MQSLLVDKYLADYPNHAVLLSRDVVIAGAPLHYIGKVQELNLTPAGAEYTAVGELIGHVLLGRDLLREAATRFPLSPETLLRLEHIIVSHQRLPEWKRAPQTADDRGSNSDSFRRRYGRETANRVRCTFRRQRCIHDQS